MILLAAILEEETLGVLFLVTVVLLALLAVVLEVTFLVLEVVTIVLVGRVFLVAVFGLEATFLLDVLLGFAVLLLVAGVVGFLFVVGMLRNWR